MDRILGILQAQYTLAYCPENIEKFCRIQVNVHRSGVTVTARREVDSTEGESVHFDATLCEASPLEHPYPWEPLVTGVLSGTITYRENFSDPRTGWPNRAGSRYASGAYEISHSVPVAGGDQRGNRDREDRGCRLLVRYSNE